MSTSLVGHQILAERRPAYLPPSSQPVLMVVIDTEEEFEWSASFDREATGVTSIREFHRVQSVFDERGVRPVIVVDYPVASQAAGIESLGPIVADGRAEVGVHLHPWVNPPHDEQVTPRNSYQGNLPAALERRKLELLIDRIEESFAVRPRTHKAGRYGFGPNTLQTLLDLGVDIDLSAASAFDLSADGGPDYRLISAAPYWVGDERPLLGLPTTGGFVGPLRFAGPRVYAEPGLSQPRGALTASLLSKARVLERILLSPEGHTLAKMRRLTRSLFRAGLRVFTMSFHSPTLKPGCTPYASTAAEVDEFLDRCRGYLDFFLGEFGGVSMTAREVRDSAIPAGAAPGISDR